MCGIGDCEDKMFTIKYVSLSKHELGHAMNWEELSMKVVSVLEAGRVMILRNQYRKYVT